MKLRYLPEAIEDLRNAIAHYRDISDLLSRRFVVEFKRTIQQIVEDPKAWSRNSIKNTRRRKLRTFPYGVIYRPSEVEILIVCVTHASRRPGWWRDRL